MSNTRRVRPAPRPPDEVETAFRDELRRGCPYCNSRVVKPDCRTHTEQILAHRIADEAAQRAAVVTGQRLGYRAFGEGVGRVEGAVVARAGVG